MYNTSKQYRDHNKVEHCRNKYDGCSSSNYIEEKEKRSEPMCTEEYEEVVQDRVLAEKDGACGGIKPGKGNKEKL
jgi:hypothetical protein